MVAEPLIAHVTAISHAEERGTSCSGIATVESEDTRVAGWYPRQPEAWQLDATWKVESDPASNVIGTALSTLVDAKLPRKP